MAAIPVRITKEAERLIKDPGTAASVSRLPLVTTAHTTQYNPTNPQHTHAVPGISAAPFEDNLRYFNVVIEGPRETPYEGGVFKLELYLPEEYPMTPPVRCGGACPNCRLCARHDTTSPRPTPPRPRRRCAS